MFNIIQQFGEIPFHANILIIISSTLNTFNFDSYYRNNQVTILTTDHILNTTMTNWIRIPSEIDFVLISGELAEESLQILNLIGPTKTSAVKMVNWFGTVDDLESKLHILDGIRNYGLDSHLYFNLINCKELVEVYSLFGARMALVMAKTGSDQTYTIPMTSLVKRRKNFRQGKIIGTHVRTWNMSTSTGRETSDWNNQTYTPTYQYLAFTQDFFNFSLETTTSSKFAQLEPDGTWIGMIAQVLNGQAHLAISAAALAAQTAQYVRFLSPVTSTDVTNLYYGRHKESSDPNVYNTVFRFDVLIAISVTIIVFSCAIVAYSNDWNSIWWLIAWITQNDSSRVGDNRPTPIRCLAITVSAFSMLVGSTFSGFLIYSLAVHKVTPEDVDSLIEKGYSFGLHNNSYIATTEVPSIGEYGLRSRAAKIISHLHPTVPYLLKFEGAQAVVEIDRYAFVSDADLYSFVSPLLSSEEICLKFHNIPLYDYMLQYSSFVRKDSPFVEYFNFARLLMKESGIAQMSSNRKAKTVNSFKPVCPSYRTQSFELGQLMLPFFILAFGGSLALSIIIVEILSCKTPFCAKANKS